MISQAEFKYESRNIWNETPRGWMYLERTWHLGRRAVRPAEPVGVCTAEL